MDTADPEGFRDWRITEAVLQQAVSFLYNPLTPFGKGEQVANRRQLPSSFGLRTRDRTARLQSSDVPDNREIPSATDGFYHR